LLEVLSEYWWAPRAECGGQRRQVSRRPHHFLINAASFSFCPLSVVFCPFYVVTPCRTRRSSMTFYFGPPPRHYEPSPPIPNTWAPRSAFSASSTPGGRISCITLTYISSCPAADCHPTGPGGSLVGADISCRSKFSPACSGGYSSRLCRRPMPPGSCSFSPPWPN